MKSKEKGAPITFINDRRQGFVREQARQLTIALWRHEQHREGRPLTALELLPIDPRAIARDLLGLTIEEPEEIGLHTSTNHLRIEIAGLLDRSEKKLVVARRGLKPETRRFTIAHEIKHYVLDREQIAFRDSPRTDAELRNSRVSVREREADIFAAELLMPSKTLKEVFYRLFPGPIHGTEITENLAILLTDGKLRASELTSMPLKERAELVARASSIVFRDFRSLVDIFLVSPTAMAIQLYDLGLVN
jgi:Zn-dependent peptidase ImmA (M78 family)